MPCSSGVETSQDFVVAAANAIRTRDDANCRCLAGVTLRAAWTDDAFAALTGFATITL